MSSENELDKDFTAAYERANNTTHKFPPDIRLQFYAYYKQATENSGIYVSPDQNQDLINAFKINALLQIKGISAEEAKRKYIELVNRYIPEE